TARMIPVICWLAHVDTSPETTGKGVKPVVHSSYDGSDLVLPGDPSKVLRPSEYPELKKCIGRTVITTDGTTLLGADNKSGVAVIMETAAFLTKHPEIPAARFASVSPATRRSGTASITSIRRS